MIDIILPYHPSSAFWGVLMGKGIEDGERLPKPRMVNGLPVRDLRGRLIRDNEIGEVHHNLISKTTMLHRRLDTAAIAVMTYICSTIAAVPSLLFRLYWLVKDTFILIARIFSCPTTPEKWRELKAQAKRWLCSFLQVIIEIFILCCPPLGQILDYYLHYDEDFDEHILNKYRLTHLIGLIPQSLVSYREAVQEKERAITNAFFLTQHYMQFIMHYLSDSLRQSSQSDYSCFGIKKILSVEDLSIISALTIIDIFYRYRQTEDRAELNRVDNFLCGLNLSEQIRAQLFALTCLKPSFESQIKSYFHLGRYLSQLSTIEIDCLEERGSSFLRLADLKKEYDKAVEDVRKNTDLEGRLTDPSLLEVVKSIQKEVNQEREFLRRTFKQPVGLTPIQQAELTAEQIEEMIDDGILSIDMNDLSKSGERLVITSDALPFILLFKVLFPVATEKLFRGRIHNAISLDELAPQVILRCFPRTNRERPPDWIVPSFN